MKMKMSKIKLTTKENYSKRIKQKLRKMMNTIEIVKLKKYE